MLRIHPNLTTMNINTDKRCTIAILIASPIIVQDVWTGESLGDYTGMFTAKSIPYHGSGFYRLSATS